MGGSDVVNYVRHIRGHRTHPIKIKIIILIWGFKIELNYDYDYDYDIMHDNNTQINEILIDVL